MSCIRPVLCQTSRFTAMSYAPCSQNLCRHFHVSQTLSAEPLKKKKRLDPQIIIDREKKRLRKIDKEIERIKQKGAVPKPIDEMEMDLWLKKETDIRQRVKEPLSFEESECRALLNKEWCRVKTRQHMTELKALQKVQQAQKKALEELRKESEELYDHAIQPDEKLIPYSFSGPYLTPPIEDYDTPDGEYKEIIKTF